MQSLSMEIHSGQKRQADKKAEDGAYGDNFLHGGIRFKERESEMLQASRLGGFLNANAQYHIDGKPAFIPGPNRQR